MQHSGYESSCSHHSLHVRESIVLASVDNCRVPDELERCWRGIDLLLSALILVYIRLVSTGL